VYFIDTNILIRVLTQDDPIQSPQALAFLDRVADGKVSGLVTEGVLVEVIQVLAAKNTYAVDHRVIRERLMPLLTLPNLQIEHRAQQLTALDLFAESRLDYVDCLAIAYAQSMNLDGIVSFDRGLDRHAPGVRFEPEGAGTAGEQEQQPMIESDE